MWDYIFRWDLLWYILLALYIPSCIGLIVIVLLQKGKGVGFAGAFGVGSGSDTVFGPRMSKTLPQRLTYVMAATFMVIALIMSLISGRMSRGVAPSEVAEGAAVQTDLSGLDDLGAAVGGSEAAKLAPSEAEAAPAPAATETAPAAPEAPASPAAPPISQQPISDTPPAPAPQQ
jgi:protein translocase SecG subunit